MINQQYNYNDSFPRMISIGLIKTFTRCVTWINYFSDKKMRVSVPFYLSTSGNDSFLLDAFVDDIVDKRVELNTDQVPRGIVTLTGVAANIDEMANPNQYVSKKTDINDEFKEIVMKVKSVPMTLNYDIEIVVTTEIDTFKVIEKLYNMLYNYAFFNIDYFGIKLDAVFNLPDESQIDIQREVNLESEHKKFIKFSVSVDTYYPIFQEDTDDYIVCDNDDSEEMELYWAKGCKEKPPLDDTLSSIKRVNWKAYYWDLDLLDDEKPEDRSDSPTETF